MFDIFENQAADAARRRRPETLDELRVALDDFAGQDPVERARRAPELAADSGRVLANERGTALSKAWIAGRSGRDLARELGITRAQVYDAILRARTVPPAVRCPNDCAEHPEHVYVLCYGRPVLVADRDHLPGEEQDYPIDHYVGFTRQHPPIKRVWSHANRSAHHIAALFPGTLDDEEQLKIHGRCPACDESLWYYATPRIAYLRLR